MSETTASSPTQGISLSSHTPRLGRTSQQPTNQTNKQKTFLSFAALLVRKVAFSSSGTRNQAMFIQRSGMKRLELNLSGTKNHVELLVVPPTFFSRKEQNLLFLSPSPHPTPLHFPRAPPTSAGSATAESSPLRRQSRRGIRKHGLSEKKKRRKRFWSVQKSSRKSQKLFATEKMEIKTCFYVFPFALEWCDPSPPFCKPKKSLPFCRGVQRRHCHSPGRAR